MNDKEIGKRFDTIDLEIKEVETLANDTKVIVSDGLQDRMIKVEKTCNWLMKTLITLLLLIIASTITLYATNTNKINEVLIKMEKVTDDSAN